MLRLVIGVVSIGKNEKRGRCDGAPVLLCGALMAVAWRAILCGPAALRFISEASLDECVDRIQQYLARMALDV
jgi:hypothetical protein